MHTTNSSTPTHVGRGHNRNALSLSLVGLSLRYRLCELKTIVPNKVPTTGTLSLSYHGATTTRAKATYRLPPREFLPMA